MCRNSQASTSYRRGGALLAVLWLTAALSAIAFSVANTVRGETERASTAIDGMRGYYLAAGAVERATLYILWGAGAKNQDGSARFWERGMSQLYFRFPGGEARVEIIPAASRLDINQATPEQLMNLLLAIGAEPARAEAITTGILDWRSPGGGGGPFDQHYLSQESSFQARHASFEEIEEVLLVRGMTPELFYGSYVRDPDGRLVPRSGLRDCLTVYGSTNSFDANTADPALLISLGMDPPAVDELVRRRRERPFLNTAELDVFRQFGGRGADKLGIGGISIYTIRATARHRLPDGGLSDMRRSVAATVKFLGPGYQPPYHILRWHDNSPADTSDWQ